MATSEASDGAPVGSPWEAVSLTRLWVAAIATFVVGDVLTTTVVLSLSEIHTEANPLVREILRASGSLGLVGFKLLFVLVCVGLTVRFRDRVVTPVLYGPPAAIGLIGLYATVHNAQVLVTLL